MPVIALVATPHAAFGELLRISLLDSSLDQIQVVQSAQAARTAFAAPGRPPFNLAIFDSDLQDESFIALCHDLLKYQPDVRLVVIPPENNPNHSSLGDLKAHGYLSRPFYQPDLKELVQWLLHLTPKEDECPTATVEKLSPDPLVPAVVATLRDFLGGECAKTQALAALVGEYGLQPGEFRLISQAGTLPEDRLKALAEVTFHSWDPKEKADLMRYVRIPGDANDYLTYATRISCNSGNSADLALVMVYGSRASISTIRRQTRAIAQTLTARLSENFYLTEKEGSEKAGSQKAAPEAPESWTAAAAGAESDLPIDLQAILGDIPAPDPLLDGLGRGSARAIPDWEVASYTGQGTFSLPGWDEASGEGEEALPSSPSTTEAPHPAGLTRGGSEKSEAGQSFSGPISDQVSVVADSGNESPFTPPPRQVPAPDAATVPSFPKDPPLSSEDTRPSIVATLTRLDQLEPVSPALARLKYTCVILPRVPQHYLIGELADRLAEWMPQTCLAYGWRLEALAIRPDYLQWTVQVAPLVSPGSLVCTLRQHISYQIFNAFPALASLNPSGDFWAPGYLIVSGGQLPSPRLLRDYIAQTRRRQGATGAYPSDTPAINTPR